MQFLIIQLVRKNRSNPIKLNSQSNTIDIRILPKVAYLVKEFTRNGVKVGKLVKE